MLIETFADLICPWCYIGKRRLDRALAQRPALRPDIRWQPFQLNPDMPQGGMGRDEYLAAKFGGADRARQVYRMVEDTAARDGLPLALDRIRRTPNSFDAHRLIRIATRQGMAMTTGTATGTAMAEALFAAYFSEGIDIGDRDALASVAGRIGLDETDIRRQLATDAESAAVNTADALARQMGLQAVPCYIFNRRYALSGAQEPGSFLPLLDLGSEEPENASAVAG